MNDFDPYKNAVVEPLTDAELKATHNVLWRMCSYLITHCEEKHITNDALMSCMAFLTHIETMSDEMNAAMLLYSSYRISNNILKLRIQSKPVKS